MKEMYRCHECDALTSDPHTNRAGENVCLSCCDVCNHPSEPHGLLEALRKANDRLKECLQTSRRDGDEEERKRLARQIRENDSILREK